MAGWNYDYERSLVKHLREREMNHAADVMEQLIADAESWRKLYEAEVRSRKEQAAKGKPEAKGACAWKGCDKPAAVLACDRASHGFEGDDHPEPATYCSEHAERVADECAPEYVVNCPHCKCRFGVN